MLCLGHYSEASIPGEPVSALTERAVTAQALDNRTGLMFYRARWYDPRLGRFIQADTIVPGAGYPQALDSLIGQMPLRRQRPRPIGRGLSGWGRRIRTPTYGSRVRCPTVRRAPNVARRIVARFSFLATARQSTPPPPPRLDSRFAFLTMRPA